MPEFRIINLVSRLPTKANNWDSIAVITINRSSSAVHIVKGHYNMWSRHREEMHNRFVLKRCTVWKTEGAAVGVMLYQIGSGRSKPGLDTHISIWKQLCATLCTTYAFVMQLKHREFNHCCMWVCVFKQVLIGQIVINLNSTRAVSTWHTPYPLTQTPSLNRIGHFLSIHRDMLSIWQRKQSCDN